MATQTADVAFRAGINRQTDAQAHLKAQPCDVADLAFVAIRAAGTSELAGAAAATDEAGKTLAVGLAGKTNLGGTDSETIADEAAATV